ncbi:hypothetical protein C8J57DRAFT_1254682 [Mycena rebaudengoi]|nr:hypothetical protein C8J57DRAFT_1254682 [Mycena rebaudengoi]
MTYAHMGVALLQSGVSPAEWDYDLIAASGYIIAASVDLMLKARDITHLRDEASKSSLLPALICAERVVSVGTGSSLFTIFTAVAASFFCGRRSCLRKAGIALITLGFALTASGFTLRAHNAISRIEAADFVACRASSKLYILPSIIFLRRHTNLIPYFLHRMIVHVVVSVYAVGASISYGVHHSRGEYSTFPPHTYWLQPTHIEINTRKRNCGRTDWIGLR